jgi:hypothetical protein
MDGSNTRSDIGVANLWTQLKGEVELATRAHCFEHKVFNGSPFFLLETTSASRTSGTQKSHLGSDLFGTGCVRHPLFQFPDGSSGFIVSYRQDHGEGFIRKRAGRGRRFVVKTGLETDRKRSVALAILQLVSHKFETLQKSVETLRPLADWLESRGVPIPDAVKTDSGYSQEDLFSNLVGFYIAVGVLTQREAMRRLHPVSRQLSEAMWKKHGPVGGNKNYAFKPQILNSIQLKDKVCTDECSLQPKVMPPVFGSIEPAPLGGDFIELPG